MDETYQYDALTRRIVTETAAETRHCYFNSQWRAIEERVSGAVKAQYVWNPADRWDLIRRKRSTTGTPDEIRFVLRDYLDPVAIIDGDGHVIERYRYDALGPVTVLAPDFSVRATSECGWNFLYHAEFIDTLTGLYNYGYRYYDPLTGRWPSRDPIEESGGSNLYDFVRNASISLVDVLGSVPHQEPIDRGYGPGRPVPEGACSRPPMPRLKKPPKPPCCDGKPYDASANCCIDGKVVSRNEKETIKICFRPADIPGGSIVDMMMAKRHCWAKTSTTEAGQGIQGSGVPGQLGGGSGYPGIPTTMNNHSGQSTATNAICVDVEVNKCCFEDRISIGSDTGGWWPLMNDCNSVMKDSVTDCGGDWDAAYKKYLELNKSFIDYWNLVNQGVFMQ